MFNEAKIITDMPGICEPGAEHALSRILNFAMVAKKEYFQAMDTAEGQQTRAFAREMHGQMCDQVKETRSRLYILLGHYEVKLNELLDAQKGMSLEDIVDTLDVERRLSMRVRTIKESLSHA